MNITLPAEQERWLKTRIANCEFQSAEDAVRQLIAERMIIDGDDMAWAKPLVDEARAAVARGDKSSLEEAAVSKGGHEHVPIAHASRHSLQAHQNAPTRSSA